MPVDITLPSGTVVRSSHLPVGVVADIAKANETNWAHVTEAPIVGDGRVMLDLYVACGKFADEPIDPAKVTIETVRNAIVEVRDDIPVEYEGGQPDPLAADSSPSTT